MFEAWLFIAKEGWFVWSFAEIVCCLRWDTLSHFITGAHQSDSSTAGRCIKKCTLQSLGRLANHWKLEPLLLGWRPSLLGWRPSLLETKPRAKSHHLRSLSEWTARGKSGTNGRVFWETLSRRFDVKDSWHAKNTKHVTIVQFMGLIWFDCSSHGWKMQMIASTMHL